MSRRIAVLFALPLLALGACSDSSGGDADPSGGAQTSASPEQPADPESTETTDEPTDTGDEISDTIEISSGPLTVRVPGDWEAFPYDDPLLREMWVAGAADDIDAFTTQIRLSANTGLADSARVTNEIAVSGNMLGNENEVSTGGTDQIEVEGADDAYVTYVEVIAEDGTYLDGFFLSAENSDTGNVATMELLTIRGEGLTQDEALAIAESASYDKSKE